jgi:hypothetical protein
VLNQRDDKKSTNILKSDSTNGIDMIIKFRNETAETLRIWRVPLTSELSQPNPREEFLIHPKMRKYVSTKMGYAWIIERLDTVSTDKENISIKGGECTCPNGKIYQVGAKAGDCSKLACEGQTAVSKSNLIVLGAAKGERTALCTCPNGEKYSVGMIGEVFACDDYIDRDEVVSNVGDPSTTQVRCGQGEPYCPKNQQLEGPWSHKMVTCNGGIIAEYKLENLILGTGALTYDYYTRLSIAPDYTVTSESKETKNRRGQMIFKDPKQNVILIQDEYAPYSYMINTRAKF